MKSLTVSWDAHTVQLSMRRSEMVALLRLSNPFIPGTLDTPHLEAIRQAVLHAHNSVFTAHLSEFLGLIRQINPNLEYEKIAQQIKDALTALDVPHLYLIENINNTERQSMLRGLQQSFEPMLVESVYARLYFPIVMEFISDLNVCKIWLAAVLNLNVAILYAKSNSLTAELPNVKFNPFRGVNSLHELLSKNFGINLSKFFEPSKYFDPFENSAEIINQDLPILQPVSLERSTIVRRVVYHEADPNDELLLLLCKRKLWHMVHELVLNGDCLKKQFAAGKSPLQYIAFNTEPNASYIKLLKLLAEHFKNNFNVSFYTEYNYYYSFMSAIASSQPLTAIYEPLPEDSAIYKQFFKSLRKIQIYIVLHNQFNMRAWYFAVDNIGFKPTESFGKLMAHEFLLYHRGFCELYNKMPDKSFLTLDVEDQQQIDAVLNNYLWATPANTQTLIDRISKRETVAFELQVMFELFSHNFNALYHDDMLYIADRLKGDQAICVYYIWNNDDFLLGLSEIFGSRVEKHELDEFLDQFTMELEEVYALPKQQGFNCTFTSMDALYHCIVYVYAEVSNFDDTKKWCNAVSEYGVSQHVRELQYLSESPLNCDLKEEYLPTYTDISELKREVTLKHSCMDRKLKAIHDESSRIALTALGIDHDGIQLKDKDDVNFVYDLGPKAITYLRDTTLSKEHRMALNFGVSLDIVKQPWFTRRHAYAIAVYPNHIDMIKTMRVDQLLGIAAGISPDIVKQHWFQELHYFCVTEFGLNSIPFLEGLNKIKMQALMQFPEDYTSIFRCRHFSAEHLQAFKLFAARRKKSQDLLRTESDFSHSSEKLAALQQTPGFELELYPEEIFQLLGTQALALYHNFHPLKIFNKEFKLPLTLTTDKGLNNEQLSNETPKTNPALNAMQNYFVQCGLNETEACDPHLSEAHCRAVKDYGMYIRAIKDLTEDQVNKLLERACNPPDWLLARFANVNLDALAPSHENETFEADIAPMAPVDAVAVEVVEATEAELHAGLGSINRFAM